MWLKEVAEKIAPAFFRPDPWEQLNNTGFSDEELEMVRVYEEETRREQEVALGFVEAVSRDHALIEALRSIPSDFHQNEAIGKIAAAQTGFVVNHHSDYGESFSGPGGVAASQLRDLVNGKRPGMRTTGRSETQVSLGAGVGGVHYRAETTQPAEVVTEQGHVYHGNLKTSQEVRTEGNGEVFKQAEVDLNINPPARFARRTFLEGLRDAGKWEELEAQGSLKGLNRGIEVVEGEIIGL